MGSKPVLPSRDRLSLQDREGQALLRADKPSGPRLEKDGGPPNKRQNLPAQDCFTALQSFQQFRRVDYRERRADSHVLHTRLRV